MAHLPKIMFFLENHLLSSQMENLKKNSLNGSIVMMICYFQAKMAQNDTFCAKFQGNRQSGSRVMRKHHFLTQNGLSTHNEFFFRKKR